MAEILTLGPAGTFAHAAARKLCAVLGSEERIRFERTISGVFRRMGVNTIAVVPLENSDAGSVGQTVDNLASLKGARVIAEIDMAIHHHLCGFTPMESIQTLYCHPQTYAQCEGFLSKHLSHASVMETPSNARSAQLVGGAEEPCAAIIPRIASELYGVPIIRERVENSDNNTTRFIAVRNNEAETLAKRLGSPTKSSMIIDPKADRPGLLYDILGVFKSEGINLTKIESRPSKRELGDYIFYLEMESDGSRVLQKLREMGDITFLGAYANVEG